MINRNAELGMINKICKQIYIINILTLAILSSTQSRCLSDGQAIPDKNFSVITGWRITSRTDRCRATNVRKNILIGILHGRLISEYVKTIMSFHISDRLLSSGYKGVAIVDVRNKIIATSNLTDVGDLQSDKRIPIYARADFPELDAATLKSAHKLIVFGNTKAFKAISIDKLNFDKLMPELDRCLETMNTVR